MRVRNRGLVGRHYWVPHPGLCGPWCQSLSHVVFLLSQCEKWWCCWLYLFRTPVVWICFAELPIYFTCALCQDESRESECRTSASLTSSHPRYPTPKPFCIDLVTWFHFPRYFFPRCWTPFSTSAFAVTPVLISESFLAFPLIPSIMLFSSSLASGFLVCPVNCIHLLRQGCGGSVGQETPATSS